MPHSQAAVILTHLFYTNDKLIARGRISKLNSIRLHRAPVEGSIMTIRFDTFDYINNQWYKKLSTDGGITGQVVNVNVMEQTDGKDDHQELIVELLPQNTKEYLTIKTSSTAIINHIDWKACNTVKQQQKKISTSKRDQFHEIIESDMLF
jgi:hypothetical protein